MTGYFSLKIVRSFFFDKNVSVDMIFIYVWNWMSSTAMWTCIQIEIKFNFIKILYLSEERLR